MKPILVRIREIINTKGMSDSQFAREMETAQTTIANMFVRDSEPRSDLLERIISNYKVNPDWLLTGEGEMFKEENTLPAKSETRAKIPVLSQKVSCGPGKSWESEQNIEGYIDSLTPLPSLSGKNIYAFRASGMSMIGIGIQDGDVVFFDGSHDQRTRDGIYIFDFAGDVFCKLLRFEPLENKVMVYSVHKPDLRGAELIRTIEADSDEFHIFGRVLAWLHENTVLRGI
ncbi:XRE family transcriptional regulator [Treponema pectinovorum]|uniref:XRE family transcriptional regulator n=1 Tax=Treponema pectinovorum TaxID=164 RepID=UPI0011C8C03F|nr:S24 family peptidase [Treponema pectinovorum]